MNQFSLFPNVKPKTIGEIDQHAVYVKWFLHKHKMRETRCTFFLVLP